MEAEKRRGVVKVRWIEADIFYLYFFFFCFCLFFFFNDTATTEIYTLSLHDALPIYEGRNIFYLQLLIGQWNNQMPSQVSSQYSYIGNIYSPEYIGDRINLKVYRDRSEEHTSELQSHWYISYAVFCLKKKKIKKNKKTKKKKTKKKKKRKNSIDWLYDSVTEVYNRQGR